MKAPLVTVIDFETFGISRRPKYPPVPVGYSIKRPGEKRSKYYAWGHPTENNCTIAEARRVLAEAWRGEFPLLFQNAKFDIDVAETHMQLKRLDWSKYHDTLYQIFLHDPYADSFSLKPSAERILGMKPTERDAVRDWILANVPEAKRKPSEWGAYIALAPGKLVGAYADGDVIRTEKLFQKLTPALNERSMLEAYDRERKLMPILLDNERQGICVDLARMELDYAKYQKAQLAADYWLCERLRVKDLNIDSDRDFANALNDSGVVTEWIFTPSGQMSVAKDNLTPDMFNDKRVASVYGYRNRLQTCLGTFLGPWIETARETNGIIFTNWNQVRQSHGKEKLAGARTGRLSSNPNFQNIPKSWQKAMNEGYVHPAFLKALPGLPLLRSYFLPDHKDHVWGRRDYNQQELRILAHFEDGRLMQGYNEDPRLDVHQMVHDGILDITKIDFVRDKIKILNFQDIYGSGVGKLAEDMGVDVVTAKRVRSAKRSFMPDFAQLEDEIKARGKAGLAIRTWGGREYFSDPPKYVPQFKRVMDFHYKLLNYLIQGSAADCTKQSIINYYAHPKSRMHSGDARFLLTVHDEIDISGHKKIFKEEMALLREVMQDLPFDVPMLSDGENGPNWGSLTKFKEPEYKLKKKAASA